MRLLARALAGSGEESPRPLRRAWQLARGQGALLFELRAALDLARFAEEPCWPAQLDAAV